MSEMGKLPSVDNDNERNMQVGKALSRERSSPTLTVDYAMNYPGSSEKGSGRKLVKRETSSPTLGRLSRNSYESPEPGCHSTSAKRYRSGTGSAIEHGHSSVPSSSKRKHRSKSSSKRSSASLSTIGAVDPRKKNSPVTSISIADIPPVVLVVPPADLPSPGRGRDYSPRRLLKEKSKKKASQRSESGKDATPTSPRGSSHRRKRSRSATDSHESESQIGKGLSPRNESEEEPKSRKKLYARADLLDSSKVVRAKEIAKGSFGVVYRGTFLGTEVAIKKFFYTCTEEQFRTIHNEVEILKKLRHPNVVLFMGLTVIDDDLHLVQEFVEGGSVRDLLEDVNHEFSWLEICYIALQIGRVLYYLHENGILHRDLKCENILLDKDLRVKVADFGLSRLLKGKANKVHRNLSAVGSPWHRAPEVDNKQYGSKIDVFSFGITMAELLTRESGEKIRLYCTVQKKVKGELLFGIDQEALIHFVEKKCPSCPPALVELTKQCCAEDAKDRPRSKQIMKRLLDTYNRLKQYCSEVHQVLHNYSAEKLWLRLTLGSFVHDSPAVCKVSTCVQAIVKSINSISDVRQLSEQDVQYLREVVLGYAEMGGDADELSLGEFKALHDWVRGVMFVLEHPQILPLWECGFIRGFVSKSETYQCLIQLPKKRRKQTVIIRFSQRENKTLYVCMVGGKGSRTFNYDAEQGRVASPATPLSPRAGRMDPTSPDHSSIHLTNVAIRCKKGGIELNRRPSELPISQLFRQPPLDDVRYIHPERELHQEEFARALLQSKSATPKVFRRESF